jgi:hypothetical protein
MNFGMYSPRIEFPVNLRILNLNPAPESELVSPAAAL